MQQIIAKNTKTFFTSWHLGFNSANLECNSAILYLENTKQNLYKFLVELLLEKYNLKFPRPPIKFNIKQLNIHILCQK